MAGETKAKAAGESAKAASQSANLAGKSGYEKIYDWVAEELPGFDLAANAPHLGLKTTEDGAVVVPLLTREFRVDQTGAAPLDGLPAHFNRRSLAAHYAMSPGRGEPAMDFVKLSFLSGVPIGTGFGSFNKESITSPLVRRFGDDFGALEAAVRRLGGSPDGSDSSLGHAWIIYAFPKIPLRLVYQPADEEFEAEFTLLYDRKAVDFMQFEALGFLSGILVSDLIGWEDRV
ncbi:MAG: DUF3786 domain-containing protein [Deltaproteobacteria bacterium]|jgi:hypothetical protein|nr:DUF3786 domain-containing protein [Deltaproteobacteria bacterium]